MPAKTLKKRKLRPAAAATAVRIRKSNKGRKAVSRRRSDLKAIERRLRIVEERLEDAMDVLVSRAALKDPTRIDHDEAWKRLGI